MGRCEHGRWRRKPSAVRRTSFRSIFSVKLPLGRREKTTWPNSTAKPEVQRLRVHHACRSVVHRHSNQGARALLLGQLVQGEPGIPASSSARRHTCSKNYSQGSACRFVSSKRASPVTSRAHQEELQSLDIVCWAARRWLQDTSWLASTSGRKARENAHPPGRRCKSVRLRPTAATGIEMSMSDTRRARGNTSVPVTPSRRPPQNSPASVLPDLPAFCGHLQEVVQSIVALHVDGRRIGMYVGELQNAEDDEVTNVDFTDRLFVRGKESPLISKDRSCNARAQRAVAGGEHTRACILH